MEKSSHLVRDGEVLAISEVPYFAISSKMRKFTLSNRRDPKLRFLIEGFSLIMEKEMEDKLRVLLCCLSPDAYDYVSKLLVDASQWEESGNRVYDILKDLGLFSSHCDQPEGKND